MSQDGEEAARCPGPEGPDRRPLHRRVGLLRRADGRTAGCSPARSAWRCSDWGAAPRAGTRDGLQGPARPLRLRGGGAGRGRRWCPCSATPRSSGSTRSTSSGSTASGWPGSLHGLARGGTREALGELEPLPAPVADLLATKSKVGGKVGIRWCSALVKPEDAEVLARSASTRSSRATSNRGPRPATCCSRAARDPTTSSGGARTWASR